MPNEYKVETLQDFMKIPADKIDICLSEFAETIKRFKQTEGEVAEFVALVGAPPDSAAMAYSGFTWIDDGERNVSTTVTFVEKKDEP